MCMGLIELYPDRHGDQTTAKGRNSHHSNDAWGSHVVIVDRVCLFASPHIAGFASIVAASPVVGNKGSERGGLCWAADWEGSKTLRWSNQSNDTVDTITMSIRTKLCVHKPLRSCLLHLTLVASTWKGKQ